MIGILKTERDQKHAEEMSAEILYSVPGIEQRDIDLNAPDSTLRKQIADLLRMEDFTPVYEAADRIRQDAVGDTVHIRAIIEFSNICSRQCIYCGLNCRNHELARFRMSTEEIVETARTAVAAGYRTIVLQSGEDRSFPVENLGEIVSAVKSIGSKPPAVTLSCGEMSAEDYEYLKEKGADRYLLKHETADAELYDKLHPCGTLENRVKCLRQLKKLGYETGSGFMIGLPGQTPETIADDLLLLKDIGCHMAGIGPFIANPKTPLAGAQNGDPELTRRAVAIARILLPYANLPVTTSLSVLTTAGKQVGISSPGSKAGVGTAWAGKMLKAENPFAFGANVIMKKVTPDEYKKSYEIYPAEFKPTDIAADRRDLEETLKSLGRIPL